MNFPPPESGNNAWMDQHSPGEYVSPLTGARESEKLGGAAVEKKPSGDYAGVGTPVSSQMKPLKYEATDFSTLKKATFIQQDAIVPRTMTDYLLDICIPVLIFALVGSVIFFLLDVRYVYTAKHDFYLRFVALFFLVGVVALNRLIAREGHAESIFYMIGLAGAMGLYTLATTGTFEMGSVAKNFMNDSPVAATFFNMALVCFIWWVTNRLTHECCVDENKSAGDIGILTGTVRSFQESIRRDPKAKKKKPIFITKKPPEADRWLEMVAYDPSEGNLDKPEVEEAPSNPIPETAEAPKRHPGISIFYFSVPVMLVFAIGLRVIQHGGPGFVLIGWFYLFIYAFAALMLLQLTSLAGLREYFRARRVQMPTGIGTFWVGLATLMVLMVLVGAAQLPLPSLPPLAHVAEHELDPWARGADALQLQSVAAQPVEVIRQTRIMTWLGRGVLAVIIGLALLSIVKGIGIVASIIGQQRDRWPVWVIKIFNGLDRLLSKLTSLPSFQRKQKALRIDRALATCANYKNSLSSENAAEQRTKNTGFHVEYAYEALCALAQDLAVPRHPDQTPYEFINAFPKELSALKDDALALTRLYVMAAYSGEEVDPRVEKILRKFWLEYNRVRARVIR